MNDFISDAVRTALAPARAEQRRVELPTLKGGALLPGVDLDDSAVLLDLMEEPLHYTPRTAMVAERPRTGFGRARRKSAE